MSKKKPLLIAAATLALAAVPAVILLAADPKPAKPGGKPDPAVAAAEKERNAKNTFLDPKACTPDFLAQGEYVGEAGGKKVAAQVASYGAGDFTVMLFHGGLPGDGWDGKLSDPIPGKAKDPATAAEVQFGTVATLANGVLKVAEGNVELKKVERKSPTMGAKPPAGAIVLFGDDKKLDEWNDGHVDDRGLLAAGATTKRKFKNFTLHGEFILPFKPYGRDQDRGNSGFYLQKRYEVQVLDSFGTKPVFNGTGALYRQTPPDLNMCLPPLSWQTYDIDFTSPEFDAAGKKTKNAVITVKLNGVAVHTNRELTSKTGAGSPEGAEPGPIWLQGHGNPVFYRNVWIVEK
ncbi:MAG TPA: DUF1080 domain-containing protein [Humisphaera sp.]